DLPGAGGDQQGGEEGEPFRGSPAPPRAGAAAGRGRCALVLGRGRPDQAGKRRRVGGFDAQEVVAVGPDGSVHLHSLPNVFPAPPSAPIGGLLRNSSSKDAGKTAGNRTHQPAIWTTQHKKKPKRTSPQTRAGRGSRGCGLAAAGRSARRSSSGPHSGAARTA